MSRRFLVAVFLLALAGAAVCAEEILLKDGSKITGKITGVKDEVFQVKTSYGDIQIPRTEIVSITFPENQPKAAKEDALPEVDESLEGTRYVNRTANFELALLAGWKLAPEIRKQSKDIIAALSTSDETVLLLVTPESYSGSFTSYKALVEVNLKGSFGNYQKQDETELTLDGKKGVKIVWTGLNKQANDAPMKSLVAIVPYEKRMVRVAFITLEPLFDENRQAMEKILATYKSLAP
jgi:hypothetical protein